MKKNKILIAVIVVAAVAAIVLLLSGRPQNDFQPTVAKKSTIEKNTTAAPAKLNPPQSPEPAAVGADIAEYAAENEKEIAPPVTEPFGDHVGDVELKPIEAEELVVDWEAASEHPPLVTAQLSDEQKQVINEAPVPVLLPDHPILLGDAVLTNGAYYFAASMKEDDVSILVNGVARIMRVAGENYPEPPSYGDPELPVHRANGIVQVYFKAFGIYYDLSVECADHENDTRCTDDHYALALVNDLRMAQDE